MAIDLAMNAAPGKKVVQHLGNSNTLEMLHLETTGNNFEVLEFDKKFLSGAYAVFISMNRTNTIRILYMMGTY